MKTDRYNKGRKLNIPRIAELFGTTISDIRPPSLISSVSKNEKMGRSCARRSNSSLINCTALDPEDKSFKYPREDPTAARTLLSVPASSEPP